MEADRENPKTEHEKTLYQNTTDEKGAQKKRALQPIWQTRLST